MVVLSGAYIPSKCSRSFACGQQKDESGEEKEEEERRVEHLEDQVRPEGQGGDHKDHFWKDFWGTKNGEIYCLIDGNFGEEFFFLLLIPLFLYLCSILQLLLSCEGKTFKAEFGTPFLTTDWGGFSGAQGRKEGLRDWSTLPSRPDK